MNPNSESNTSTPTQGIPAAENTAPVKPETITLNLREYQEFQRQYTAMKTENEGLRKDVEELRGIVIDIVKFLKVDFNESNGKKTLKRLAKVVLSMGGELLMGGGELIDEFKSIYERIDPLLKKYGKAE